MSLRDRARAVLRANDRGRFTVPAPHLYPHQWAWDSAFAAIGWSTFDVPRATVELETLMSGVWSDGRLPHIQFADSNEPYFPGPEFWGTERSSSIAQPPVQAIAALRLLNRGADSARIAAILPAIEASHRWFMDARDPLGWSCVAVAHPWESGLDNSPAWDDALMDVDISDAPAFRRVDTERVDDPDQRPPDAHYVRYAALVKAIKDDGFGAGPFAVYDPLMTSILAVAEGALSELGARLGFDTGASTRQAALQRGLGSRLYDASQGRFLYYDVAARRPIQADVVGCYMPLITRLADRVSTRLRAGLTARFDMPWPLPTTSPTAPTFEAHRYWRGPTWININWLLAPALDIELRARSLELMAREGFREYYDARTGDGLGARDFTWSAALALDWLAEEGP